MTTMNDLLYNYQENNEFVCSDGRMSVNGICQVEQPDSVDTSNITKEIIETSKNDPKDTQRIKDWEEKVKRDKVLKDLEGESDYFPKLGKEKNKFEWNFDKDQKIDGYKNTVNNNINAYNGWIENNLGIPTGVQTAMRVGGSTAALAGGSGVLAAVAPWALPVLLGGAINRAERERIENITDQDKQGGNINTIDMMTYNAPQPGDEGFNIHTDKTDWRGTTQDQGVTSDAGFDRPHGTDTSGSFAGKGSGNPFGH